MQIAMQCTISDFSWTVNVHVFVTWINAIATLDDSMPVSDNYWAHDCLPRKNLSLCHKTGKFQVDLTLQILYKYCSLTKKQQNLKGFLM